MKLSILKNHLHQIINDKNKEIIISQDEIIVKDFPYEKINFKIIRGVHSHHSYFRIVFKDSELSQIELKKRLEIKSRIDGKLYSPIYKVKKKFNNIFTSNTIYIYLQKELGEINEKKIKEMMSEIVQILKTNLSHYYVNSLNNQEKELINNTPLADTPVEIEEIKIETFPEKQKSLIELGNKGEKYLDSILRKIHKDKLRWLNEKGETGCDHDFELLNDKGKINFFIGCKATNFPSNSFYLSMYEWDLLLKNHDNYLLYFVIFKNKNEIPIVIKTSNFNKWLFDGLIVPYNINRNIALPKGTICFSYVG